MAALTLEHLDHLTLSQLQELTAPPPAGSGKIKLPHYQVRLRKRAKILIAQLQQEALTLPQAHNIAPVLLIGPAFQAKDAIIFDYHPPSLSDVLIAACNNKISIPDTIINTSSTGPVPMPPSTNHPKSIDINSSSTGTVPMNENPTDRNSIAIVLNPSAYPSTQPQAFPVVSNLGSTSPTRPIYVEADLSSQMSMDDADFNIKRRSSRLTPAVYPNQITLEQNRDAKLRLGRSPFVFETAINNELLIKIRLYVEVYTLGNYQLDVPGIEGSSHSKEDALQEEYIKLIKMIFNKVQPDAERTWDNTLKYCNEIGDGTSMFGTAAGRNKGNTPKHWHRLGVLMINMGKGGKKWTCFNKCKNDDPNEYVTTLHPPTQRNRNDDFICDCIYLPPGFFHTVDSSANSLALHTYVLPVEKEVSDLCLSLADEVGSANGCFDRVHRDKKVRDGKIALVRSALLN
jgi:hypothetical protein